MLHHHVSTGGKLASLLDVGSGPGNSTRELALSFEAAMGVDASPGMISSAHELGGKTSSGDDVVYEVAAAEEFSNLDGLQAESLDLVTVANAVGCRCCCCC